MKIEGLDYHDVVAPKSDVNNGLLQNLTKFKLWLKYPNYYRGLINIQGETAFREISTINQIMSTVYNFYDFLVIEEGIDNLSIYKRMRDNSQFNNFLSELFMKKQNKFTSILKEKEPKKLIKYITRDQYNLIYRACNNRRNRIIIGLMFEGGLRVSEVIGLNIEDLKEIHNNKVQIVKRNDINNPDAAVKYNSSGIVDIPDYLRDEIISYMNETLSYIDTNYFIIVQYGDNKYQPMKRSTIEKMIGKLGKATNIKDLHPHMLRHGCAVSMLESGIPIVAIKDKLRHKSIETTADIYAEFTDNGKKEAMKQYCEKANLDFTPDKLNLDDIIDELLDEEVNK